MNHSLYSADRATHFRIVVAALSVGITIAALATVARVGSRIEAGEVLAVVKVGKPTVLSSADTVFTRQ